MRDIKEMSNKDFKLIGKLLSSHAVKLFLEELEDDIEWFDQKELVGYNSLSGNWFLNCVGSNITPFITDYSGVIGFAYQDVESEQEYTDLDELKEHLKEVDKEAEKEVFSIDQESNRMDLISAVDVLKKMFPGENDSQFDFTRD